MFWLIAGIGVATVAAWKVLGLPSPFTVTAVPVPPPGSAPLPPPVANPIIVPPGLPVPPSVPTGPGTHVATPFSDLPIGALVRINGLSGVLPDSFRILTKTLPNVPGFQSSWQYTGANSSTGVQTSFSEDQIVSRIA
jgi:hypothetical protein